MPNKLYLSIPTPCHENWQNMTPQDKGRFCAACQKTVVDFTMASNRHIAEAVKGQGNLCGRFRNDQLERDLVIPKDKNSLWMAGSAAILAFMALGSSTSYGQARTKTEAISKNNSRSLKLARDTRITVTGTVADDSLNIPIPGAFIKINGTKTSTETDQDGRFTIAVNKGDVLQCSSIGYKTTDILIEDSASLIIKLEDDNSIHITEYYSCTNSTTFTGLVMSYQPTTYIKPRNFFSRIFHSIGSIFR